MLGKWIMMKDKKDHKSMTKGVQKGGNSIIDGVQRGYKGVIVSLYFL